MRGEFIDNYLECDEEAEPGAGHDNTNGLLPTVVESRSGND